MKQVMFTFSMIAALSCGQAFAGEKATRKPASGDVCRLRDDANPKAESKLTKDANGEGFSVKAGDLTAEVSTWRGKISGVRVLDKDGGVLSMVMSLQTESLWMHIFGSPDKKLGELQCQL